MLQRFKNAWHNIVLHPTAGMCWLLGFQKAGDWVHGDGPVAKKLRHCPQCQEWHDEEEKHNLIGFDDGMTRCTHRS